MLLSAALVCGYRYRNAASALTTQSERSVNRQIAASAPAAGNAQRERTFSRLAVLILKSEKRAEVWGMSGDTWSRLRDYPVLAASGGPGPKLREGDRQVPEGIYRVKQSTQGTLQRSIRLDYPNAFDLRKAALEGRTKLGGEISLRGKAAMPGCVSLDDAAIEDLCALINLSGPANVEIIIAPNDLRTHIAVKNPRFKIDWLSELYETIRDEMKKASPGNERR